MTNILTHIQGYVPCKQTEKLLDAEPFTQTDYQLFTTLVDGDQLSAARARNCVMIQDNAENNFDKLNGLLPVVEDWHVKVCLIEVRTFNCCTTLILLTIIIFLITHR